MKISILTLFPEMFAGPFQNSILKIAQEKELVTIRLIQIRDFGMGTHKIVDDKPYGGGAGMILRVDILHKAIEFSKDKNLKNSEQMVALLDPHGQTFTQKKAVEFSKLKHLILLCGHYEGVDERIKKFIDLEISIGDFVVTGGEIPAMLITDSVVRLLKGVLKEGVTSNESFSFQHDASGETQLLEYPHYTRPPMYKNLTVPDVLLSGNHNEIKKWREKNLLKTR